MDNVISITSTVNSLPIIECITFQESEIDTLNKNYLSSITPKDKIEYIAFWKLESNTLNFIL